MRGIIIVLAFSLWVIAEAQVTTVTPENGTTMPTGEEEDEEEGAPCLRDSSLEPAQEDFGSNFPSPSQGNDPKHPCLRDCNGAQPMECEFDFHVEWYYVLSKACYNCPCNLTDCDRKHCVTADGVQKPIIVANKALPGTPVEVCDGDQIILNLTNHMANGEGITVHFHGLPQKSTPYMDGVPMITQCPVIPHSTFTYNFTANHPGTHWWHAHTGMQRADGLFGALIIRQSDENNPHRSLYDHDLAEHKVVVNDWMHEPAVKIYLGHHYYTGEDGPDSMLINGKGQFAVYKNATSTSGPGYVTPREVFEVEQGMRYRFRVVSSGISNTPMKVSVDGHNLTLIESDGSAIEPVTVDAFFMYAGERYDFVLNAGQEVGNYWLKVRGFAQGTGKQGLAVIRYKGANITNPTADPSVDREGDIYQELNSDSAPEDAKSIDDLRSLDDVNLDVPEEEVRKVYLTFDHVGLSTPTFNNPDLYPYGEGGPGYGDLLTPQVNNRSFAFLDYPPLSQFDDERDDGVLCEVDDPGYKHCDTEYCACFQVIQVDVGQMLELVLIAESKNLRMVHPFHLHGHAFRVLAQAEVGASTTLAEIKDMDQNGEIVRNFDNPPEKDTVSTPGGGYTVIRFVAENPGWWFFHCHMEFHLEDGMGIILRVGSQADLPPKPDGFPVCGDFPSQYNEENTSIQYPVVIILSVVIAVLLLVIIILVIVMVCRGSCRSSGKRESRKHRSDSDGQSTSKL